MSSIYLPAILAQVFATGHLDILIALFALVVATGVFWWWLVQRLVAPPPASEVVPEAEEAPAEDPPPATEGPGHLIARFGTIHRDLEQVTRDLQRYNGSREAQLQGWQQLSSDIMRRILPVLENLEPFLDDDDETVSAVARMAHGRLLTELTTLGVTLITPAPGEPFNGRYHLLGPDTTGYPPYRIKAVIAPGYLFTARVAGAGEVVLKPAEVVGESTPLAVEPHDDAVMLERVATGADDV